MDDQFTRDQIHDLLRQEAGLGEGDMDDDFVASTIQSIDGWTDRGDGCAVYRNEDIGHPDLGRMKFVSFGSEAAQLEVSEPPSTLPDIGEEINWRYQLFGTYTAARDA